MKDRKPLKRVGTTSKIMKLVNSGFVYPVVKAIKKKQKPANDITKPELKVHESVTIPLNDPFHDV